MTDWPKLLRSTRDRLGLSQAKLARALGVTERTVLNWENGHTEPGHPEMMELALKSLRAD